jgi:PKD domain
MKIMKKVLIGILICILLITNVSANLGNTDEIPHGNIAGMGPNLAPNPSFEEGDTMPTGWIYDPDTYGIYTWDSNYAYAGEKSVGVLNLTDTYPTYVMWITTDFIPVNCTVNSYMLSAWFKFVDILIPMYQYATIRILEYDINYQPTGSSGVGRGSNDSEWHQISDYTGYDHGQTKYVKLEIGQAFNFPYEPDPLIEIRFDDVYFGLWNTAPNTPTITGETNGRVRTLYDYTFTTIDPDQDNVSYEIEWGDNTTQTTDLYESGEEIIISHIWGIEGTYSVRVKAIDENHAESDWVTLTVTMPCSYILPFMQYWMKLLERFPNAFPILRFLLDFN